MGGSLLLIFLIYYTLFLPNRQGASADKPQVKAAKILPLAGLTKSKQGPINRQHGTQYLYRPTPAAITYALARYLFAADFLVLALLGASTQTNIAYQEHDTVKAASTFAWHSELTGMS
jgi:hypothetical protein